MSQPPAGSATFAPYSFKYAYTNKSTQFGKPFYAKIIDQRNAENQAKFDAWKALPDGDAKYQKGVELGYINKVDYDNYITQKAAIDAWNSLPDNDAKYKKGVELGYIEKADYDSYMQKKITIDRWNAMPDGLEKAKEGLKLGFVSTSDYNSYINAIESNKAQLQSFNIWSGQPMTEASINDGYNKGFYGADVRDKYIQELQNFKIWKDSPDTYQKMQEGIENKYMTIEEGTKWYDNVLHNQWVAKYNGYNPEIERLKTLVDRLDPQDQLLDSQNLREELRTLQEAQLNYGANLGLITDAEYKAGREVLNRNNSIEIYNSMPDNTIEQQLRKLEFRKENIGFDSKWTSKDYDIAKSAIDSNKKIVLYNNMPENTFTEKLDKLQYRKDNFGFTSDWTKEMYNSQVKSAEQEVFINKLLREGVIETESKTSGTTNYLIKKTDLTKADISLLKDAGFKLYDNEFVGPTGNIATPKPTLDQGAISVKLGNIADQFGESVTGPFGLKLDPKSLFATWAVAAGEIENLVNPLLKGISPLVNLIPGTVPFDYGDNYDIENMPTSLSGYKRQNAEFLANVTREATNLVLIELAGVAAGKALSVSTRAFDLPASKFNLDKSVLGDVLDRAGKLFDVETVSSKLNLSKSVIGGGLDIATKAQGKIAGVSNVKGAVNISNKALNVITKIPITRSIISDVASHGIPLYFETEKVLSLQKANVPFNEIMAIVAKDVGAMVAFDDGFALGSGTRSMLDIDLERVANLKNFKMSPNVAANFKSTPGKGYDIPVETRLDSTLLDDFEPSVVDDFYGKPTTQTDIDVSKLDDFYGKTTPKAEPDLDVINQAQLDEFYGRTSAKVKPDFTKLEDFNIKTVKDSVDSVKSNVLEAFDGTSNMPTPSPVLTTKAEKIAYYKRMGLSDLDAELALKYADPNRVPVLPQTAVMTDVEIAEIAAKEAEAIANIEAMTMVLPREAEALASIEDITYAMPRSAEVLETVKQGVASQGIYYSNLTGLVGNVKTVTTGVVFDKLVTLGLNESQAQQAVQVLAKPQTFSSIQDVLQKLDTKTASVVIPTLDTKLLASVLPYMKSAVVVNMIENANATALPRMAQALTTAQLVSVIQSQGTGQGLTQQQFQNTIQSLTPVQLTQVIQSQGIGEMQLIGLQQVMTVGQLQAQAQAMQGKVKPMIGQDEDQDDERYRKEKPSKKALLYKVMYFYKDKTKTVEKNIYARTFSDALNRTWFERGSNVIPKRVRVIFLGKEEVKK